MRRAALTLLLAVTVGSGACSVPPVPPEVSLARDQEEAIRRAGGTSLAPEEHGAYLRALKDARSRLRREDARFLPIRNYEGVTASFRSVLQRGELLLDQVQGKRRADDERFAGSLKDLEMRSGDLKRLSRGLHRQRLFGKEARRAELFLGQASVLYANGSRDEAWVLLRQAERDMEAAGTRAERLLDRYRNPQQAKAWNDLTREVIDGSARNRAFAIVVDKLGKTLTVYRGGTAERTFRAGIGRNSLADKLAAGDGATPEGLYHVVRKATASEYHKALLIDYPNDEDRRRFRRARARGLVPSQARIGGLIEIHGGGSDSLTDGCIALDNGDMDALYEMVPPGTPVAIVGTTKGVAAGSGGASGARALP